MKIAITGAGGALGRALTRRLQAEHEVRATDIDEVDVRDPEAVSGLCAGMDRVVHLARAHRDDGADAAAEDGRILDTALQGTYHVLQAARAAGVGRVIQVSDICVYSGYPRDVILSEDMVALPDTSAEQQAQHLAEGVAHEFGAETPGLPLTLRLGRLVDVLALPVDVPFDPDWLDLGDATDAIVRGLQLEGYDHPTHWGLYNLVADTPHARFRLRIREGRYQFTPGVDFRAWWPEDAPVEGGTP